APYNVTVNTVSPTFIHTDGTAPFLSDADNHKATLGHIPLGRIGETDDVVGAVIFLASPAESPIIGANLLVDGEWSVA
ncbi:SDR family oxidoreductase, partial [Rhizobium ecuadorense]|uniref:SDR family oxidoreductase n=1 Tax=Rhizobium ecuadorense TaxID=1671795 RepID=UPI000AA5C985